MKLYGKNPVIERLRANPSSLRKIFIQEGFADAAYIRQKARKAGVPVFMVSRMQIHKIRGHGNTQGIIGDITDFEYLPLEDLLETAKAKKRTIIFLDNLTDPQNLGAIIRTLACFGKFSLVLPTHDSVEVTESVLRVASGGENYVPIAKVANLKKAIEKAKEEGFWILGTVVKGGNSLMETTFSFPLGIVIGSEQKGIRDIVRQHLDGEVNIPMHLDTLSLNVAHAASIICYEITKQKQEKKEQS
jgi:23S rRNA (guanosine2251-2'-O)-methyltransferase